MECSDVGGQHVDRQAEQPSGSLVNVTLRLRKQEDTIVVAAHADQHTDAPPLQGVREVSPEEGAALLDRRARRYLGLSGQEFLRRWEAGDYAADPDQPGVIDVAMLLPFAHGHARR